MSVADGFFQSPESLFPPESQIIDTFIPEGVTPF